jgi:starch synthase (maltosyl-transferring)
MLASADTRPPARIQIEHPAPLVDCGRYRAKRTVGDVVEISADVFRDGHEALRAAVLAKGPDDAEWSEHPMRRIDAHVGGDRWSGSFEVTACGPWTVTVEAWVDPFASWREELARKVDAGQVGLESELSEGALLLERTLEQLDRAASDGGAPTPAEVAAVPAAAPARPDDAGPEPAVAPEPDPAAPAPESATDRARIAGVLELLRGDGSESEREGAALDPELQTAVTRWSERAERTRMDQPLELDVDRPRARFGSWYELFPRSWGGLAGVTEQLPALAELGFDVLYLPPVHPIGRNKRKGRNNALVAGPGDPGSPWAIGAAEGGHTALHPELGTMEEFDALAARARKLDVDLCIDFAIQCSADHPWLTEHPEWFNRRPDGTLKYAENPPKRYQDIYNVNWASEDWRGLWDALLEVVRFWVDHGVTVFRVDNPHTKPLPFWKWLIAEVRRHHPEVIFLAEAFTRAAMMRTLAKLGFSQSYTYFTWKNSAWELREYVTELASSGMQEFYRPNFFANTPDILNEYLVHGGPAAFRARLLLAGTLSPTYGIYSGFESFERVPVREGSEEYLDSEKYETKARALDGPLLPMVGRLNRIRRENPALQRLDNVTFLPTENDALLAYLKREDDNVLLCVVNTDPHAAQAGICDVPLLPGLPTHFWVNDLLDNAPYEWHVGRNYVRLDPWERPGHVMRVEVP